MFFCACLGGDNLKESIWGYAVMVLGLLAVGVIWFFANVTRTDQHNFNLLKETVEAAMIDSVDISAYRTDGTIKIIEEKFVANFIRRFAENADLSNSYKIEIFDVNEIPPKVSLRVSSTNETAVTGEHVDFKITNNIDAILEAKYFSSETEVNEGNENNGGINNQIKNEKVEIKISGLTTTQKQQYSNFYYTASPFTNNKYNNIRIISVDNCQYNTSIGKCIIQSNRITNKNIIFRLKCNNPKALNNATIKCDVKYK